MKYCMTKLNIIHVWKTFTDSLSNSAFVHGRQDHVTSRTLLDRETRVLSIWLLYKKHWKLYHAVNQQHNRQSCWSTKPPNGFHCLKSLVDIECAKVTCSVVLHVKTRCVSNVPWLTIFWEYHAISNDGTDTSLDDISSQLINKYYLQNKIKVNYVS
jgi:hypothetical protein